MKSQISYVGRCLLLIKGKERVLVIGDLHLGFEESLNKSGILVTRMMLKQTIEELDRVFDGIERMRINDDGALGGRVKERRKVGVKGSCERKIVDKVVLLGDVKHAFGSILRQEWGDVLKLFEYLEKKCCKIIVIKGNHDMILGPIAKRAGLKLRNYWMWNKFCFTHGDENYKQLWSKKVECIIVGHGHPAIRLQEGARSEKYKCFLVGVYRKKKFIVVPSFSEWYAGSDPREGDVVLAWNINFDNFDVFAVGGGLDVLNFGKLRSIK